MAASAPPPATRFDNITLLRAFAALSVVVFHVIEHGRWTAYPESGPLAVFRYGWYGVDLFFVISGFVIAYSALTLYRADAASFGARYWKRRLARILPLYLATLVLYLALFPPWTAKSWALQVVTHLTFTHSFAQATHGAVDGPNWSLAIEMHFYLAVAAFIHWIDRAPAWKIGVIAIIVSWAYRAAIWLAIGGDDPHRLFVVSAQLPGVLDEFGAGIVLAKLLLDSPRDWFGRSLPWAGGAVVTGAVAISLYAPYWQSWGAAVFWHTALAAFFMCIVGAAVALPRTTGRRWLRPIDYLGETSYGIYLWHLFAINLFVYSLGWSAMPALMAVLALTVALAAASWHLFEKPALRRWRG